MIVTNISYNIHIEIRSIHMIFYIFCKKLNHYEISDMEIYITFGILS